MLGTVEGIYVAPGAEDRMVGVREVSAVEGRGLEGDRYAETVGTYSHLEGPGRQVTFIDAAALEALAAEHGIQLPPGASRRNIVTRGVNLLDLVGKTFRVGDALIEGVRDCPPCTHLEGLTRHGVKKGLEGRGGLRADIRRGGAIRVGDPIRLAEEATR